MFSKNKNRIYNIFRKKSKIERFYLKNREFIYYCLISLISTIVLFVLFALIDFVTKGNYLLANFVSYTVSFAVLFVLNQKLFKSRPHRKRDRFKQLLIFIIIRIIGFPLDSFVLHILISNFNMQNFLAKVTGSLIMFAYNYITNKLFVFKKVKLL